MATINAEQLERVAEAAAKQAEGFGAGGHAITEADVRRVAMNAARIAITATVPALLDMLEEAVPFVEEGEQFNKPTHRGLSGRMKAVVGWGK